MDLVAGTRGPRGTRDLELNHAGIRDTVKPRANTQGLWSMFGGSFVKDHGHKWAHVRWMLRGPLGSGPSSMTAGGKANCVDPRGTDRGTPKRVH